MHCIILCEVTEEQADGDSRQEVDVIGPLKQEVNGQTGEERDPDELAQNHDEPDRLVRELFGRQHRGLSRDTRNTIHYLFCLSQ